MVAEGEHVVHTYDVHWWRVESGGWPNRWEGYLRTPYPDESLPMVTMCLIQRLIIAAVAVFLLVKTLRWDFLPLGDASPESKVRIRVVFSWITYVGSAHCNQPGTANKREVWGTVFRPEAKRVGGESCTVQTSTPT